MTVVGGANGDSTKLITFTIDDVEYQAEDGMTWSEWCDSDYNIDNYYRGFADSVCTKNGIYSVGGESDYIYATDTIIDGYSYILVI